MADWIPYETSDQPALEVSFDVDFSNDEAFRATHPFALTITATGFAADEGGQPSDAAADGLFALEQRIEVFCAANDAASVCTVSGNGSYIVYAYAANENASTLVRQHLAGLAFAVEAKVERDDAWRSYERYALRGEELEEARDHDQIEQLDEAGDDLSQPYVVTFDCEVDASTFAAARQALTAAGFQTSGSEYDSADDPFIAAARTMVVTAANLKGARAQITRAIAPFGGRYDGWGAEPLDEEAG